MASRHEFVAYYRVSKSLYSLGIDEQRAAVSNYASGRNWKVMGEFIDVETRKRSDRPELNKAISAAQRHAVPLVVAHVGQLTRSLAFLTLLLDAKVDARFPELPAFEGGAARRLLRQMAAVAELEAGVISATAKVALAAAKARGNIRGGDRAPTLWAQTRAAGRAAMASKAKARATELAPVLAELRAAGITSLRAIAAALDARAIPTARGRGRWSAMQVGRLLARLSTH